jgi:hypothetical protein
MKVYGIEITQAEIDACVARMKLTPYFGSYQIERVLEKAGHRGGNIAMRAADRIIQRERKAGNIVRCRLKWRHKDAPAPM